MNFEKPTPSKKEDKEEERVGNTVSRRGLVGNNFLKALAISAAGLLSSQQTEASVLHEDKTAVIEEEGKQIIEAPKIYPPESIYDPVEFYWMGPLLETGQHYIITQTFPNRPLPPIKHTTDKEGLVQVSDNMSLEQLAYKGLISEGGTASFVIALFDQNNNVSDIEEVSIDFSKQPYWSELLNIINEKKRVSIEDFKVVLEPHSFEGDIQLRYNSGPLKNGEYYKLTVLNPKTGGTKTYDPDVFFQGSSQNVLVGPLKSLLSDGLIANDGKIIFTLTRFGINDSRQDQESSTYDLSGNKLWPEARKILK